MGVSIDYRKLELVSQFAGLLEALSDPTLKETLVEARKVIEEKKALLGPLAEKANLEALIDREEVALGEKKAKMEALLVQAQEEAKAIVAKAKEKQAEASEKVAKATALEQEQAALLEAIKKDAIVFEDQKAYMAKAQEELKANQEACAVLQTQLAEKTARVQKMLGE